MSFAEILKFWLPARSKNRMCRSQLFNQICLDRGCAENVGISMTIPTFACYSQYIDKKLILKIRKRMLKVGQILSLGDFMTSLFWLHSWCSSPQKQINFQVLQSPWYSAIAVTSWHFMVWTSQPSNIDSEELLRNNY